MSKGHAEAENKHMFLMKQLKPKTYFDGNIWNERSWLVYGEALFLHFLFNKGIDHWSLITD